MRGAEQVQRGLDAGFSPEEIKEWVSAERSRFLQAGFSQEEIDEYFGMPPVDDKPIRKHFESALGAIPVEQRQATTFMQGLETGLETSVSGLLAREKGPDLVIPEDAGFWTRIGAQTGTVAGDLPFMVGGALIGAAPGGGIGSAATATAGAFALPAGLRRVLMEKYENGEIDSFGRFWEVAAGAFIDTFKGYLTGAATGAAGAGGRAIAGTLTAVPAEITAMVTVGKALEGEVPEPMDFVEAAVVIGGLRSATGTAGRLRGIYARTGRKPAEVIEDAKVDPSIREDLQSKNHQVPRAYKGERPDPDARIEVKPEKPVELTEGEVAKGIETGTPEAKVFERISMADKGKGRASFKETTDQLYTDWFDRLHPLKVAVDAMREGKDIAITEDAYRLARLNVGVEARANHFLEYSPIDFNTLGRVGKPLKAILEPVKDPADLNRLRAYMLSKRSIEVSERGIETGVDLAAARETVAKYGTKMEPVAREIVEFQQHVFKYLKDSGILSDESHAAMVEMGKSYIPLYRALENVEGGGSGKGLRTRNPVFALEGSELRVVDPLESIIKNTHVFVSLADRNEIAVKFADLVKSSERGHEFGRFVKGEEATRGGKARKAALEDFLRTQGESLTKEQRASLEKSFEEQFPQFDRNAFVGEKGRVSFFRNGKKETMVVTPEVYEAFAAGDVTSAGLLVRMLAKPSRLLRAGAILSPEFIGRNPIRDQLTAFLFSDAGFKPYTDSVRGIFSLAKKDADYQAWLKSGGPMATMVSLDRNYLQQNVRRIMGETGTMERARNVVLSPIEALRILSETAEQATRIGEFKRSMKGKAGTKADILEAGFASREVTLDFGRIGAKARAANQIIAFFNAQVQGVDKVVRSFKDHPARTSARIAAGVTLPSVVLYLLNRDKKWYKDMPAWQRDLFWPIEANGTIYRIPKPFEVGVLFGTGAERTVEWMLERDPEAFDDLLETVIRGSTPSVVPTGILPVMEAYFNRSVFLDRPLVPSNRENVLPEYQYFPYTTELTKAIAKSIATVPGLKRSKLASPAIIDNTVRGWTGQLGQHIWRLADKSLREAGVLPDPVKPADTLADIPFIKGFVVRYPSAGSSAIEDFYEGYREQEQIIRTIRILARDGEPEAAMLEYQANAGSIVDVSRVHEAISNISKVIRLIYRNPNISADEKRQLIDELQFQRIGLAEQGNKMLDMVRKIQ